MTEPTKRPAVPAQGERRQGPAPAASDAKAPSPGGDASAPAASDAKAPSPGAHDDDAFSIVQGAIEIRDALGRMRARIAAAGGAIDGTRSAGALLGALSLVGGRLPNGNPNPFRWAIEGESSAHMAALDEDGNQAARALAVLVFGALEEGVSARRHGAADYLLPALERIVDVWTKSDTKTIAEGEIQRLNGIDDARSKLAVMRDHHARLAVAAEARLAAQRAAVPAPKPEPEEDEADKDEPKVS